MHKIIIKSKIIMCIATESNQEIMEAEECQDKINYYSQIGYCGGHILESKN